MVKKKTVSFAALLAAWMLMQSPLHAAPKDEKKDPTTCPPPPCAAHSVSIYVAAAPGSPADLMARGLAKELARKWGTDRLVVENRPDPAAFRAAVASAKDAHSLYLLSNDATTARRNDVAGGLLPVALIGTTPLMLAGLPQVKTPFAIKADPTRYPLAVASGSISHAAALSITQKQAIPLISFDGSAKAAADAASGGSPLVLADASTLAHYIEQGQLRPLAATSRISLPGSGSVATFADMQWPAPPGPQRVVLFAPPGTSETTIAKLNREIAAVLPMLSTNTGTLKYWKYATPDAKKSKATVDREFQLWKELADRYDMGR